MPKQQFRVNANLLNVKAGAVISLDVDAHGVPLDRFWRRRLKDAAIDNCIEAVAPKRPAKPTTKPADEKDEG